MTVPIKQTCLISVIVFFIVEYVKKYGFSHKTSAIRYLKLRSFKSKVNP